MERLSHILTIIDELVWGPVMLALMLGTGIFLTIRTGFLPWRNLGYGIRNTFRTEARSTTNGSGDVSPFATLATALAATIGTGNIVGVTTAMVSGGPGALVWMWLSAAFGISSKFGECMLAIKYRERNSKGEMSGGPMYTMKKAFKNKKAGALLGWCFAFFAVIASFGIGNMTQANSIAESLFDTFHITPCTTGIIVTILTLLIIVGGIKNISTVATYIVPFMAFFYIIAGLLVILLNIRNLPTGISRIFTLAFSTKSVTGGFLGTIVASMSHSIRYGVARGVFSNEAGMGSTAITAAAAATDHHVRQGYINMTDTFWDTMVICTITGLCVACSGVLGTGRITDTGTYIIIAHEVSMTNEKGINKLYTITETGNSLILTGASDSDTLPLSLTSYPNTENQIYLDTASPTDVSLTGTWRDTNGNTYTYYEDGHYEYMELYNGAALTIAAFRTALGDYGAWLITIGIVLFAFATILGWEYHGEKAWEYLLQTHKYNMLYRMLFSLMAYIGATTALDIVWNFSDIANALMALPNLICLIVLSGEIARDAKSFQKYQKGIIKVQKEQKKEPPMR